MATQTVITAVVHELLNHQTFTDYTDFVETVKERCAKLRIRYDAGRVTDAIRVVERTRVVLVSPKVRANPRHLERIDEPPISKADARQILAGLGIRL